MIGDRFALKLSTCSTVGYFDNMPGDVPYLEKAKESSEVAPDPKYCIDSCSFAEPVLLEICNVI